VKRSSRLISVLLVLFVFVGAASFAQVKTLSVTTNKTVVDGVVNPNEYSVSQDFGQMSLYVNRTADALSVAVVGSTTGWVAIGLGSLRMDGSTILMGYVDAAGKVAFKPQAGQGHTHQDAGQDVQSTVISYAIKEAGGKTTLEVALKPSAYIKTGQSELDLIYAQGNEDSFTPKHMFRGAVAIKLAQ
jgi:hypothetical protein